MFKTALFLYFFSASPVGAAISALESASDVARDHDRCEQVIGHDLAAVLGELRDARKTGPTAKLSRAVQSLARDVGHACPSAVAQKIAEAVEALEG